MTQLQTNLSLKKSRQSREVLVVALEPLQALELVAGYLRLVVDLEATGVELPFRRRKSKTIQHASLL